MDNAWMERTQLLVGKKGIEKLMTADVLVVGLGGVGSYAAEAIARAGVGSMTIIDGDVVDPTNRNRQLQALSSTHGQSKALLLEQRIKDIHPDIKLTTISDFLTPDMMKDVLQKKYSYIIDAIDSISPKLHLIQTAYYNGRKIISSMGAGGKMDPTRVKIADISKTDICPLAQYVRKRLKYMGIYKGVKCVFSDELPAKYSIMRTDGSKFKKSAYGTISYLPAVFGLTCASVVIKHIADYKEIR
ncbi:MAG TPA: tRNA threonylcarbamoyladenosine dehydratase [Bacteroidia bacterium]|jgi:tRNA A37 threonylcarbamoyladenosine dehydratase|nr:tRNA threonylcarbamoyladenosine dehydratase [Bacteroidia bacterium]